jgi:hypothetical protein
MPGCSLPDCGHAADFEVILYDFSAAGGIVFFGQDDTCQYICHEHARENESRAEGERRPRGIVRYPYTNLQGAQGFTIYRPLEGKDHHGPSTAQRRSAHPTRSASS